MHSPDRRPPRLAGRGVDNAYLLLALAGLWWSGNHVMGRAVAGHVPPLALSTLRWIIPATVLWLFARHHIRRDWPSIKQHWRVMALVAMAGGGLFGVLQFVALQYTTAVNVAVLNSLPPVLIVLAGTLIFRDSISLIQIAGIATSLLGVMVIVTRADLATLATLAFNGGDIIVFFNMALWAAYSACLRLLPPIHWLSFIFVLAVISMITAAPLFVWEHLSGYTLQPTLLTAGSLLYISVFSSLLSYFCWNRGVELIGANRAGVFLHLIPIYGAILATIFLGEELMLYHVLGFVLILTGVWLAGRRAPTPV